MELLSNSRRGRTSSVSFPVKKKEKTLRELYAPLLTSSRKQRCSIAELLCSMKVQESYLKYVFVASS